MALSTVDADGVPDSRMVLLKDVDARGFTFYSNAESAKGLQLAERPVAALLFHWKSLRRQVRVRGAVEPVTPPRPTPISPAAPARAGSAPGPRTSRGRWTAAQTLEAAVAARTARFDGRRRAAPRPLDRLARGARQHRVLARPAVPPARPPAVRPDRRRLDAGTASIPDGMP